MTGLATTQPAHDVAGRRPLRTHLPEMAVGVVGALMAIATALFATSADDALILGAHGWAKVRTWWPPFCAVADVVIGVAILSGIAV